MAGRLGRIGLAALAVFAGLWASAPDGVEAASARAQDAVYRIAVMEATPPFSHRGPDGVLTGFNVEIMAALCRSMRATCWFVEMPFQSVLDAVATGGFHFGLANFLRTPEREARVDFSAPYWRSSSSFVGPAGEADQAVPDAVFGKTAAAIKGSRQHAYLKALEPRLAAFVEVAHLEDLWAALGDGRARYALAPTLVALDFLLSEPGKAFGTVGTPLSEQGLGGNVHIILPRNRPDLKAAVDEAIAAIRADGSYQDVNRRYFPFDVY